MIFVPDHQANALRERIGVVEPGGIGNFQGANMIPFGPQLQYRVVWALNIAPGDAILFCAAHLRDSGVRRSGRDAGQDQVLRVAGIGNAEDRADIDGILDTLEDDGELPARWGLLPREALEICPSKLCHDPFPCPR